SQHAQLFYGRVSYHDYEGLAVDIDERTRLVRDLGDNPVMILRNHGLLAVGKSIPLAFSNLFNLQFACETQVLAMAGNAALTLPRRLLSPNTPPRSRWPRPLRSARNGRPCCASSPASIRRIAPEVSAVCRNLSPRLRFLARRRQRHGRRQRLGVDLEVENGGLGRILRRPQRGEENRGPSPRPPPAAPGTGPGGTARGR